MLARGTQVPGLAPPPTPGPSLQSSIQHPPRAFTALPLSP